MADFVAVIRRAVDGLPENNPEHRERVYQKARTAVRRQLENMSPRPSEEVVAKQLDKLEAAIGEVELEHTEALPALDEEAGVPPVEEPQAAAPPEPAEEAVTAGAAAEAPLHEAPRAAPDDRPERRYDFDDEPGDYELDRPHDERLPTGVAHDSKGSGRSAEAVPPSPFGDEPLIGDAHDEAFGLSETERMGVRRRKRARNRTLVGALVAIIVLVAAAYGLWTNRSSVAPMIASLSSSSSSEGNTAAQPNAGEQPASKATAPKAAGETDKAGAGSDTKASNDSLPKGGKYTERLMADGSETNPGPAPAPGETQPAEGHSVSAQIAGTGSDSGEAAQNGAANTAAAAGQDKAGQQPAAISQKMYLYEERFNDQAPSATTGSVVWSLAKESPGGEAPPEPAIHGEISVPDKGITALITIKRNADKSLPASHLIEIVFALPGDFPGGGIDSVQRVSLKQTEQAKGDPLIAVPAKITDNFFMVALNDYPQAIKSNLDLLKTRNWIDIPITYTNGRRALITLEKGASGTEVFDDALKAWAAEASKAADNSASTTGEAAGAGAAAPNPTSAGGTGTPPPAKPGQ